MLIGVEFETVESEGVKIAIIELENGRIELMHPPMTPVQLKNFLKKRSRTSSYGIGY